MAVDPLLPASLEPLASVCNKDLIDALKIMFIKDTRSAKHVKEK